jgi:hypothetical protein
LLNSGAFNINDEDMLYVDKDGLIYSCLAANYRNPANKLKQTLSKIPAKEFLLRLQGEWEQPNEVTEPDYKTLYEELLAKHEKPCDPQRLCCHNATQKLKGQLGESEAKYETLLQGVKDAKAEMEEKSIKADEIGNKLRDNDYHFTSNGLSLAIEILTDKTNVL